MWLDFINQSFNFYAFHETMDNVEVDCDMVKGQTKTKDCEGE